MAFKMKGFSGFKQTQDEKKTFSQGGFSESYEKKYLKKRMDQ